MKKDKLARKGSVSVTAFGTLFPFFALIMPGITLVSACKETKKSAPAEGPAKEREKEETPPAPAGPDPKPITDGHGTGQPRLSEADFNPGESPNPQSGKALPAQMEQVAALLSSLDFQMRPYTGIENFSPSAHEQQAERCINEYLAQSRFTRAGPGADVQVETLPPSVFSDCIKSASLKTASGKEARFGTNFYFSCTGQEPTGPELNGLPTTAPEWTQRYCETGQSATVRYQVSLEAMEKDSSGQTIRNFRRLKSVSSRSGQGCSWDYQPAQQIRTYRDCRFLERIDTNDGTSSLFVSVDFNNVTARPYQGGARFEGGTAAVRVNNFAGTITFQDNGSHTWSLTRDGTQETKTGTLSNAFAPGSGAQAVYPVSNQYPFGVAYTGASPLSYTPVTGSGNVTEMACSPLVSAQNVEVGGGLGNGAVSQFRSAHPSGAVFHAGYVFDSTSGERKPFVAQFANGVMVWCRTYMVQNVGNAQGVWIGDIGAAQYYAAFVADQPSFAPVGQAFQPNRTPQQKAVIYLVQFDPATGNALAGSWFDILQSQGGSFSTVLLDAAGLSRGLVRLRAFVTANQAPGCGRVATGNYGIVMRGNLSGLASNAAEFCP